MEKQRKPKTTSATSNEDLISRLPDAVLTYILSYIDTKSAVATSVLSKRWTDLWISVPNLDFGNCGWPATGEYKVIRAHFESFVDRVLNLNNVISVRNIYLEYWSYIAFDRLNSWLTSIAKRDAEKIRIRLPKPQGYYLPDCFFNQKNLVVLEFPDSISKIPQSVCFPSLKTIKFQLFRLIDEYSLKNLMFGCPVLRELYLGVAEWDDALTLSICSFSLRKLALCVHPFLKAFRYKVVIDAPNVTHLTLADHIGVSYDIRNVNAKLTFGGHGEVLSELLPKVSHVNELFLTIFRNTKFARVIANMPTFHNLVDLTLEISDKEHWLCMFRLFHFTPNLVSFVLQLSDAYLSPPSPCTWSEPIEVPYCFLSCLESVKVPVIFLGQRGGQEEMQLIISYILKNASVLKNLYIEYVGMDSERNEFLKTLLALQKGSVACQVLCHGLAI